MAFNLKKVLKALLLSSSQPLGIKDIQGAFTRFHEQAAMPLEGGEEGEEAAAPAAPEAIAAQTETKTLAASSAETGTPEASEDSPASSTTPAAENPAVASEASADAAAAAAATPAASDSASAATSALAASPSLVPVAPAAPAAEVTEVSLELTPQDPEIYGDVPSLVTATQIREAMNQIAAELRAADEGLLLIEGNSGFRIVTHPRFGKWIRILRQEPPPVKLSQSAIETLAVIAYRQPVTRGEIETIRGVSAEAGVNKLLERELIYIVGRADSPGRPIQYGTTDQFLEFVGIKSLDELPASDVLSSRQIDEWLKTTSNTATPTDTDMGLPDEQLPLEGGAATATATEEADAPVASEDAAETKPAKAAKRAKPAAEEPSAPAASETPAQS